MKVSVIATVFNENESIRSFIDGLLQQTRLPEEIIIVDAGSTDGTIEQLRLLVKKYPIIRCVVEKGCNVARGRNIAIHHSRYDYIAMTDAGSRVDRYWLEQLMVPYETETNVDIVGGWTEMEGVSSFERWICLLNKPFDKIDWDTYLPTARSLGIKKKCWEEVGGFPEELTMWSEDTVFLQQLKKKGFTVVINQKAIVYWRPRRNLREFWVQYYEYGKGDGEARIFPRLYLKRVGLFFSVIFLFFGNQVSPIIEIICIVILLLAFIRVVLPLKTPAVPAWKLGPLFLLVLVMETAQLFGYPIGRLKKKSAQP